MSKLASGFRLLRVVLENPQGVDLQSIAVQAGVSETQARKGLRELVEAGMLVDGAAPSASSPRKGQAGERFQAGPDALALAALVRANFPTTRIASPVLKALARETGETVVLNVYMPEVGGAVCVAVEHTTAALHYVMEVGEVKPLHAGASGKAILAFLPDEEIDAIVSGKLEKLTADTVVDRLALKRELLDIRKAGYCVSSGQRIPGAIGIAAALTVDAGRPASLVLTTPRYRFDENAVAALIGKIKHCAGELERIFNTYS